MRDGILSKIRAHIDAHTDTRPRIPDPCWNAYCRNGDRCTLYDLPLCRIDAENCELGVYGETFSFLDVMREVGLALALRIDNKNFEYECCLLYNACIRALEGDGKYSLTLQENHCKTCTHRKDGHCEILGFSPPDCDNCNHYAPPAHEHRLFDPFCL